MTKSSKSQRSIDAILAGGGEGAEVETVMAAAETISEPAAPRPAKAAKPKSEAEDIGIGPSLEDTFGGVGNLDAVLRIPVTIQVVLGSAVMPVANLMKLRRGAAIPLDHRVGEPVDVVVNGRTVARGEVVVVEDDTSRFGISLTEIVGTSASN
jgi:flagellar motor switch protein FliN/FliY